MDPPVGQASRSTLETLGALSSALAPAAALLDVHHGQQWGAAHAPLAGRALQAADRGHEPRLQGGGLVAAHQLSAPSMPSLLLYGSLLSAEDIMLSCQLFRPGMLLPLCIPADPNCKIADEGGQQHAGPSTISAPVRLCAGHATPPSQVLRSSLELHM